MKCRGISLSIAALGVATSVSCRGESKFASKADTTVSKVSRNVAAGESVPKSPTEIPGVEGLPTEGVCANGHRALRIAFVVDNTGSNSCTPGAVQTNTSSLCGTDPIKPNSPMGDSEGFTDRQNAVYQTIVTLAGKDKAAREADASFPGSEVGLLSFPLGESVDELAQSKIYSGATTVLPKKMTNLLDDVTVDDTFKKSLWDLMKFTHNPIGLTPYKTALEGTETVLIEGRTAADPRPDLAVLITDGLPNDAQPSLVKAAREKLGAAHLIILSVYKKGANVETQNSRAKASLEGLWNDSSFLWGHASGASDSFANFEAYWKALLKLPSEIATKVIEVQGSNNLQGSVNELLNIYQECK